MLVLLGRLRQGVKFARVEPRRHEEISRAFGRGLGQDRRFDFQESGLVEFVADRFGDAVAHLQVLRHARSAQVEVAVLHPQVLVGKFLVQLERQHLGAVDHLQFAGDDLDLAGGDGVVDGRLAVDLGTVGDDAGDAHHVLGAQRVTERRGVGIFLAAEHALGHALAVAHVDEDDAVVVAIGIHPTDQRGGLADMLFAQFVAVVGAVFGSAHGAV